MRVAALALVTTTTAAACCSQKMRWFGCSVYAIVIENSAEQPIITFHPGPCHPNPAIQRR